MLIVAMVTASQVPDAFQNLIDKVEATMIHAIEEEEKIPLSSVTNFKEVRTAVTTLTWASGHCHADVAIQSLPR